MSYIHMDHAGWVERNNAAGRTIHNTQRDKRNAAEHKGYLAAPEHLTPFQRRAFDILGIVGGGIYNAPIAWEGVYWDARMISVPWRNGLGTFDFSGLTRLVFLCHEARIRAEISAKARQYIEIHLSERRHDGGMSRSHPNLDEAVAAFRAEFPADHSIVYRAAPASEAAA
jgi:hypothetical protein